MLDVERLLRRHGSEIRNLLAKWLGKEEGAAGNRRRERLRGRNETGGRGGSVQRSATSLGIGGK